MTKRYELTDEDMQWIETALKRNFTKLQMIKKLQETKYTEEKIKSFKEYYEKISQNSEPKEFYKQDDKFEEDVKKWTEGKKDELSWQEKRAVKKFLKQINKYLTILKTTSKAMTKEVIEIKNRFGTNSTRMDKELEQIKEELIDRIIESKAILDITDPKTGKEATKELLMKNDLDSLIKFFDEEIVRDVDAVVNGRID